MLASPLSDLAKQTLIISNEEMDDIMKIVKPVEEWFATKRR